MKKEINRYVCTDDDSLQYRRDNEDGTFDMVEARAIGDGKFRIVSSNIDLKEHSDGELDALTCLYGFAREDGSIITSHEELERGIVAEMVFETFLNEPFNGNSYEWGELLFHDIEAAMEGH